MEFPLDNKLISLHQMILTCISIPFGSSFPLANKTYKNILVIFAKFAREITSMRVLSGINCVNHAVRISSQERVRVLRNFCALKLMF